MAGTQKNNWGPPDAQAAHKTTHEKETHTHTAAHNSWYTTETEQKYNLYAQPATEVTQPSPIAAFLIKFSRFDVSSFIHHVVII